MNLKPFVEELRATSLSSKILKFVTGNQSADMDSVMCALSYSYLYHAKNPNEPLYLPLINVSRNELHLRKDIVTLLNAHSINASLLFFVEDIEALAEGETSFEIALVDHCNIQGEILQQLLDKGRLKVTAIIDHHADEGVFQDASPRIIRGSGSCLSLVFKYWSEQLEVSDDIKLILIAPLLLDTSNMRQKVEQPDIDAFEAYKSLLRLNVFATSAVSLGSFNTLYDELKRAKKDYSLFLFAEILKKDYKEFRFESSKGKSYRVGFSSIGKSMSWVFKKYDSSEVSKTLSKMHEELKLDAVIITTSYTQKGTDIYTRELCIATTSDELKEISSHAKSLDLNQAIYKVSEFADSLKEVNELISLQVFNQGNTAASRKQVVPLVKDVVLQFI